jgi:5-methylcytosine-specific restriction endonuclease McrA
MPGKTVPPRRRPKVHLGLRFRILERDRFRCRACGRSPANHLDCELHVDHIVPVAQGGTNAPENLRTLCADCNWGRGAGRKKLRRRGRRAKRQHDRGRRSRKSRP